MKMNPVECLKTFIKYDRSHLFFHYLAFKIILKQAPQNEKDVFRNLENASMKLISVEQHLNFNSIYIHIK